MEINSKIAHYTINGSEELETRIGADMTLIVEEMLNSITDIKKVKALVLGGGYGRGEGGVVVYNGKEIPFNDYDFFVITGSISRKVRNRLNQQFHELHKRLTPVIGIDVDFGPVLSENKLPNLPFHIMWYELKEQHRVIWGDEQILKQMPDYDPKDISPEEAVKLMLNRATGLILAESKIVLDRIEDYEFILRNIMKARIAIGDAYLICKKTYSTSYIERKKLLLLFRDDPLIKKNEMTLVYNQAIDYKINPDSANILYKDLYKLWKHTRNIFQDFYFYSFNNYLKESMKDWSDYQDILDRSFVEKSLKKRLKNVLLNVRYYHLHNVKLSDYQRYPRFRLYMAIPRLLFNEDLRPRVLDLLNIKDECNLFNEYIRLWNKFN